MLRLLASGHCASPTVLTNTYHTKHKHTPLSLSPETHPKIPLKITDPNHAPKTCNKKSEPTGFRSAAPLRSDGVRRPGALCVPHQRPAPGPQPRSRGLAPTSHQSRWQCHGKDLLCQENARNAPRHFFVFCFIDIFNFSLGLETSIWDIY